MPEPLGLAEQAAAGVEAAHLLLAARVRAHLPGGVGGQDRLGQAPVAGGVQQLEPHGPLVFAAADAGDLGYGQRDAGDLAQEPFVPLPADRPGRRQRLEPRRELLAELGQGGTGPGRRRARTEVAKYLAVVAELDPTTDLPAGFAGRVRDLVAAGQDEAAGALIPDEVLDRFAFSGTPEHVAVLAQRVLDAGAGRIDFGTPHGLTDDEGVALLGTAVLPRLQRPADRPRPAG